MTSIQRYDAWPQDWPFEADDGGWVTYADHRKIVEELEAKLRSSALQELSALGQASEAYQAQLAAEAKLERVVNAGVRMRDYFTRHSNQDVYAVQDFNEAVGKTERTGR